jgi:hypothetical protein
MKLTKSSFYSNLKFQKIPKILARDWLKGQNQPQPLYTLEAGPIWWYEFFNKKRQVLTWLELGELGAPKMEGQFLASGPMSDLNKKTIFIKKIFFSSKPNPLDSAEI